MAVWGFGLCVHTLIASPKRVFRCQLGIEHTTDEPGMLHKSISGGKRDLMYYAPKRKKKRRNCQLGTSLGFPEVYSHRSVLYSIQYAVRTRKKVGSFGESLREDREKYKKVRFLSYVPTPHPIPYRRRHSDILSGKSYCFFLSFIFERRMYIFFPRARRVSPAFAWPCVDTKKKYPTHAHPRLPDRK